MSPIAIVSLSISVGFANITVEYMTEKNCQITYVIAVQFVDHIIYQLGHPNRYLSRHLINSTGKLADFDSIKNFFLSPVK